MSIKFTKYGLLLLVLASTAMAAQEPTAFNEQDVNYTEPASIDNYIATQAPIPTKLNVYLGLQIGADLANLKFKNNPNVNTIIPNYSDSEFKFSGHTGLFGGLGKNFGNFYLGGEAGINYSPIYKNATMFPTNSKTITQSSVSLSYRQSVTGSLDLIPGYLTDSQAWLFYVRGGLAMNYSALKLIASSSSHPDAAFNDNTYQFSSGFRAGLGFEYFPNESFSVRTEYVYNIYSTFSSHHNANPNFAYVSNFAYSVKPTVNQINVGFAYHF